ncbi:hypothetical protein [Streptomyces luteosporeus]|uniref:hypothetical protein n=1 Tax=Streptomyces luteosporeus TaxID=173856 RepID=UPI0031D21874
MLALILSTVGDVGVELPVVPARLKLVALAAVLGGPTAKLLARIWYETPEVVQTTKKGPGH